MNFQLRRVPVAQLPDVKVSRTPECTPFASARICRRALPTNCCAPVAQVSRLQKTNSVGQKTSRFPWRKHLLRWAFHSKPTGRASNCNWHNQRPSPSARFPSAGHCELLGDGNQINWALKWRAPGVVHNLLRHDDDQHSLLMFALQHSRAAPKATLSRFSSQAGRQAGSSLNKFCEDLRELSAPEVRRAEQGQRAGNELARL